MLASSRKQNLGQFFTKNSDYILSGLSGFVENKEVIDPFAGNRDLMSWAKRHGAVSVKGFDIDDRLIDHKNVFLNDGIKDPLNYKFLLTNPPYLHKNKASKITKANYFSGQNSKFEDLYQVSINSILNSEEGIMIVPLNFLSAENSRRIREIFFKKFKIMKLNIFYERVFDDTTYNVVSFYYKLKDTESEANEIDAMIFPEKKAVKLVLERKYGWRMGGKFDSKISKIPNILGIYRLTESMLKKGTKKIQLAFNHIKEKNTYFVDENIFKKINKNIILLKAIDSKSKDKIQLEDIRKYNVSGLVGKQTSRNMAYLIFKEDIDIDKQVKLIEGFNEELKKAREEHLSFFLTNFRDNNRKRISFDFSYKLINYVYFQKVYNKPSHFLEFEQTSINL